MLRKTLLKLTAMAGAVLVMFIIASPVQAQVKGGGPYGDIDGYYTWEINGKGWTIYSQNGYSWVYEDNGTRTYLDSYGNKLYNVTPAAAATIAQYKLTYSGTYNGVDVYANPDGKLYTVSSTGQLTLINGSNPQPAPAPAPTSRDLVVTYVYTSAEGYNIFKDVNGSLWYFADGYYPYRWYGSNAGAYWISGISNRVYRYQYVSPAGNNLYSDDAGRLWWFDNAGAHLYSSGGTPSVNPGGKPAETNVDWNHVNTMWADGKSSVVYVNQYWQAPSTVSWTPQGTKLIGWDYAEGTGYARWKPGQWIKNTGSDLALYPVFGY